MARLIFITGGVVSSLGKGLASAALAVEATTGGEIDETLDRTVAPASDPLAPAAPQGGDLTAPVVDGPSPAPAQSGAPADDPLAAVAE